MLRPWLYPLKLGTAALLLSHVVACGQSVTAGSDDFGARTTPTVVRNVPEYDAINVPLNTNLSAKFSEAMERATVNEASFTLTAGPSGVPVPGTVFYAGGQGVFWPAAHLASGKVYTATITTGAKSAFGVPLAAPHVWSFTTGNFQAPGVPVNLGTAGNYVVLAKSRISTVPASSITGDVAISPAAASYITGFSLTADPTNVFSTATQVTGRVYAADYAVPTPTNLTTAISDMEIAFTDAAARTPDATELGAGNIGGLTLGAGVYKWSSGLLIPTDLTLSGSATDVWIFQIAQDLLMSTAAKVKLAGGALPKNVFWQVSGAVTLGTGAHLEGIVLTQTAVTLQTGASVKGRVLAQTSITIDASTISQ
jgi:hypothetical protein